MSTPDPHDRDAITVAEGLGFDRVETFRELPAGFRLYWMAASDKGFFLNCETVGDLKQAYCRYVCPELGGAA